MGGRKIRYMMCRGKGVIYRELVLERIQRRSAKGSIIHCGQALATSKLNTCAPNFSNARVRTFKCVELRVLITTGKRVTENEILKIV